MVGAAETEEEGGQGTAAVAAAAEACAHFMFCSAFCSSAEKSIALTAPAFLRSLAVLRSCARCSMRLPNSATTASCCSSVMLRISGWRSQFSSAAAIRCLPTLCSATCLSSLHMRPRFDLCQKRWTSRRSVEMPVCIIHCCSSGNSGACSTS